MAVLHLSPVAHRNKAMERYEDVSERHKTSNEEWEQAKVDARDATATFNKIKQRRSAPDTLSSHH